MNMNWRRAMGGVRTSGCVLALVGSLALSPPHASGEACTPVVYAFRHAEDTRPDPSPPYFALTPTGRAHAKLYPKMIRGFEAANAFCPVTRVYATTKAPKQSTATDPCSPNCTSATNAFDTATPSANEFMSSPPLTAAGQHQLYEFLGNSNGKAPTEENTNYSTAAAEALREELLATANRNGGESSVIFWTSEGLHVLGGAIIAQSSAVPRKTDNYSPPRNAVYLFKAEDSAPNIKRFSDTPPPFPSSLYVQCFNHVEAEVDRFPTPGFLPDNYPPNHFACGFGSIQSNLGGKPPNTCKACALQDPPTCATVAEATCGSISNDESELIDGKICNITSLLPNTASSTTYGQCN
jgi:hypothetical protein